MIWTPPGAGRIEFRIEELTAFLASAASARAPGKLADGRHLLIEHRLARHPAGGERLVERLVERFIGSAGAEALSPVGVDPDHDPVPRLVGVDEDHPGLAEDGGPERPLPLDELREVVVAAQHPHLTLPQALERGPGSRRGRVAEIDVGISFGVVEHAAEAGDRPAHLDELVVDQVRRLRPLGGQNDARERQRQDHHRDRATDHGTPPRERSLREFSENRSILPRGGWSPLLQSDRL